MKSLLTREELFVVIRREAHRDGTLTPVKGHLDAMLREDLIAPRKQKHTIERICRRLPAEHGFAAAWSSVRDYVAWCRPEIVAEVKGGRRHLDGTVALMRPAVVDEAEDGRCVHGRARTIGFDLAVESEQLAPLPAQDFDCGTTLHPMLRGDGRVVVGQCHYSVPARFADPRLCRAVTERLTYKGIIETGTGSNRLAAAGNQPRIVGRA
ncbi:hypothetical protein GCM10009838_65980 [Catenulispora subtropica]|uniref:Transposase n=1 Tax=Catenulispora subtropica TaxID=450798 RepID=A0ABP5EC87_9ACTN